MTDELKLRRPKPKGEKKPDGPSSPQRRKAASRPDGDSNIVAENGLDSPIASKARRAPDASPKAGAKAAPGDRPRMKKTAAEGEARPAAKSGTVKSSAAKSGSAPRPKSSVKDGAAKPVTARPPVKKTAEAPAAAAPARRPEAAKNKEKSLEGLGRLLKTKREIHGLTRRDVVVKIKIPLDQLEAIEEGRLSSLPPVFAKGFLRAYANELGLDAEAILEDYRQMTGGFKNEPASREPLAAPAYAESGGIEKKVKTSSSSTALKVGIFAALAVAVIISVTLVLMPGLRYTLGARVPFLGKVPGFYVDLRTAGNIDKLDNVDLEPGPVEPVEPNPFVDDPGLDNEGNNGGTGAAPWVAPESVGGILTLASRQDNVWVQVKVDDRPVEHALMKNGQELTWTARSHITVTAGNAKALSVNWNSKNMGALSETRDIVEMRFPPSS